MTLRTAPPAWPGSREPAGRDLSIGIDRIACDGYGSCAELLPEMISLDEWGYPIIRPGPVPPALLDHARMAVDTCPVLALRLDVIARATMGRTPGSWPPRASAPPGRRGRR